MWKRLRIEIAKRHPLADAQHCAFWTGMVGVERKRDDSQQAASTSTSSAVSRPLSRNQHEHASISGSHVVRHRRGLRLPCFWQVNGPERHTSDAAATATASQRLASSGTPK